MVNSTTVFNPPKINPVILSKKIKELDPRNKNNNRLVINLEIIIDRKKMIVPEIKRIHPVPICKNDDNSIVKSI